MLLVCNQLTIRTKRPVFDLVFRRSIVLPLKRRGSVCVKRLGLTRAETNALFHKHNSKHLSRLNLPLSIDKGWNTLESNLIILIHSLVE